MFAEDQTRGRRYCSRARARAAATRFLFGALRETVGDGSRSTRCPTVQVWWDTRHAEWPHWWTLSQPTTTVLACLESSTMLPLGVQQHRCPAVAHASLCMASDANLTHPTIEGALSASFTVQCKHSESAKRRCCIARVAQAIRSLPGV